MIDSVVNSTSKVKQRSLAKLISPTFYTKHISLNLMLSKCTSTYIMITKQVTHTIQLAKNSSTSVMMQGKIYSKQHAQSSEHGMQVKKKVQE